MWAAAICKISGVRWKLLRAGKCACLHVNVASVGRFGLRWLQGLVQCAEQGGFFGVPFRLEGHVCDERVLREVEQYTGTVIRMAKRDSEQRVIVMVCPTEEGQVRGRHRNLVVSSQRVELFYAPGV